MARLDGVAIDSDSPLDRMMAYVHQRREVIRIAETRAKITASLGDPDATSGAAKDYFSLASPVSPEYLASLEAERLRKRKAFDAILERGTVRP